MRSLRSSMQEYQKNQPKRLGVQVVPEEEKPLSATVEALRNLRRGRSGGNVEPISFNVTLAPPPIKKVPIKKVAIRTPQIRTTRMLNPTNNENLGYMIGIPTINGYSKAQQQMLGIIPNYNANKAAFARNPQAEQLYQDAIDFQEDPIVAPQNLPIDQNYNRLLYNSYVKSGQFKHMALKDPAAIYGFGTKRDFGPNNVRTWGNGRT